MQEDIINGILEENARRLTRLHADYNPVTGEALAELLGEERMKLHIADYAIPDQWVPREVADNPLVKAIVRAGGIDKFIQKKRWKGEAPTHFDIERRLRRLRHKHDFCFWAFFTQTIKAKKGGRIRFKLNLPQLVALAVCEKMRKAGEPIAMIILKARQWGGSTFCFFYQIWILFKWDEYHSFAIAAHTTTASETILMMLKRSIADYPAWDLGLPDGTQLKLSQIGTTGHAYAIKDNENRQVLEGLIFIGTAEKPDTLRGKDIAGVHYSEVGVWPDTPEKRAEDIVADLQGGLVERPLTMEVMESTAKNSDDFFHDVWISCEEGEGGYAPLFVPFMLIENDTRPIQDHREFAQWLYEHRNDKSPAGRWRDAGEYYWWLWTLGATLEGINWYRYRRLKLSFAKMCNEAPATAVQAFLTAGLHVFDPFTVEEMARQCREPVLVGDLVSDAREGEELLNNIRFVPNSDGNLRIWEEPDDTPMTDRYVVAVDIGGPNDTSDFSSVRVLDRLMLMPDFGLEGRPNIVAEMHYHTDHDMLAYDAVRLAEWYGHALLVIESNTLETKDKERDTGGDGFEYILDILAGFYDNLYMRRTNEDKVQEGVVGKYGFHTNAVTKPKIIDHMKTCVRDGLWREPSRLCTNEMSTYVEDHGKFNASPKKHDDVVMATAILLWVGMKEMDMPAFVVHSEEEETIVIKDKNNFTAL